jgi:hypothetical protein
VFAPLSVITPFPVLVRLPVPDITPEYVVEELSPPTVKLPLPSEMSPRPEIEPTTSLKLARSSVAPLAIATAVSSDHLSLPPSLSVPAEIVVAPVLVLSPLTVSVPAPSLVTVVPAPLIAPRYVEAPP